MMTHVVKIGACRDIYILYILGQSFSISFSFLLRLFNVSLFSTVHRSVLMRLTIKSSSVSILYGANPMAYMYVALDKRVCVGATVKRSNLLSLKVKAHHENTPM